MIKRIKTKYTIIVMSSVIAVIGLIITAINVANYSTTNSLLDEKLTMLVENDGLIPDVDFGKPPEKPEVPETPAEPGGGDDNGATDDPTITPEPGEDGGGTEQNGTEPGENGGTDPGGAEPGETEPDGTEPGETEPDGTENGAEEEDDKKEESYQHMSPETPFELRFFSVKLDTDGSLLDVYTEKIAAVGDAKAVEYAKEIHAKGKTEGFIGSYRYMSGRTSDGKLIYVFLDATRELKSYNAFLISSLIITAIGIVLVFTLVLLLSGTALKPIIESYEKQKRFITDAGHEMKTPLTIISANAEIIEMENGESQWSSGIKSQVSKLTSLTEKLVVLSKMEEGIKLEMNDFSLSEAFYDTCEQYKSIAMSKNMRFNLDIPENVHMVGSENEIRRCIQLLLDNAFRYGNEGGFVSVRLQSVQNGVEVKVTNSTGGVERGSLDTWFDRFYRTDLSRNSDTGGSGIGLSVVKAIVHAHGGTVRASSNDGINVEFTINL